jgi:hypothetical protein
MPERIPALRQTDEAMEELKRAVAILAEVGGHGDEPRPGVWRLVEW